MLAIMLVNCITMYFCSIVLANQVCVHLSLSAHATLCTFDTVDLMRVHAISSS